MAKKRQRTTWQYTYGSSTGGRIRVGWVHNPRYWPRQDTVRLRMRSESGKITDVVMTPLEAMSVTAGLMLTVQHRGWTGELEKSGLHVEPIDKPRYPV